MVFVFTKGLYLISLNQVSGVHHSLETVYQPCTKDRKDIFLTKDGPLFKLKEGVSLYPDNRIVLVGLQELKDRVKLLLILRTAEQLLVAPGKQAPTHPQDC